uniref:L-aminoadipate-semialdehyde dehydrogenase-phosphopantetheinyl transferase n=1 Tax=Panagrolaimus sp. JU765 TaxID=591449 RepID=A0AC34RIV7_9BILA
MISRAYLLTGRGRVYFLIGIRHRLLSSNIVEAVLSPKGIYSTRRKSFSSTFADMSSTLNSKCKCNRFAFSLQKAFEDDHIESFYRKAIQCVTQEDYDKIVAFRYKDDSLACLAGRLFLRQMTKRLTGAAWHEIEFARTEKGKPYLVKPEGTTFGMNVSHQGDYTVFASSCSEKVGVDVMRLDICRNNKSADEYINSMAKSASAEELRQMRGQPTEAMKMTIFYRFWCLKEAVLKATGEGIVNDLSRYDFRIDPSERYKPGCFLTSTTVLADGKLQSQWIFEESFVDNTHSIAVCREKKLPKTCMFCQDLEAKLFFSKVGFDFLLDGATVLNPIPNDAAEEFENFQKKLRKTF